MNEGEDDDGPNNTGGFFITFQGVTGQRFSLTSTDINPPYVFEEIIIGEPDA
ncbi:hypothetical protein AGMMS49546_37150 [Spirochaetia bacterium]|nr:hypothetical protein AGMMS49546_37150 [Spirochaetia bacterium]